LGHWGFDLRVETGDGEQGSRTYSGMEGKGAGRGWKGKRTSTCSCTLGREGGGYDDGVGTTAAEAWASTADRTTAAATGTAAATVGTVTATASMTAAAGMAPRELSS